MSFANTGNDRRPGNQLDVLNGEILQFTQLMNKLKSPSSSSSSSSLISTCDTLLARISTTILNTKPANDNQVYQLDKLRATLRTLRSNYLQLKTQTLDKLQPSESSPLLVQKDTRLESDNVQLQMQIHHPQLIQSEALNYHKDSIEDRSQAISNIQQGVQDINQIFKTLDKIVLQQGEQISSVEDNIGSYAVDSHLAMGELNRAEEYQRRKSKWCFFILLFLLVIVFILLITII